MAETTEAVAPFATPGAIQAGIPTRSPFQLFWSRFKEDRVALVALGFLVLLVFVAIFAGPITRLCGAPPPNERDTSALDVFGTATGPSSQHWFGVDDLGRDVFSRTIYGAQVSLIVAFSATFIAVFIGATLGLIAAYRGGWTDTLISRSVDVILAIPYLLLATGFAASCSFGNGCFGGYLKPGLGVVIFVIALTSWTYIARIVRGETLSIREKEYIEAARSVGAPNSRIIFQEILPNLTAPIIVYTSILIPQVILYEAALSFLGVGVQPPRASWGQMIADATDQFDTAWWYMLFPGLALLFTVLAFNLVGDALQDALNPKHRRKA